VDETVIIVIALIFVLLLFIVFRRRKDTTATPPPAAAIESGPKANQTRVLPVGMLIAKSGVHRGIVFPIEPSGVKIGRDKEKNRIVIEDPIISREHAWVGLYEGKVIIKDEHSSNGTYINSLESPRIVSQELKDGDVIYIGKKGRDSFKYRVG
jgi:pSer/pThr/pTyr-binding forkhead associated (FHA) protein